ncbi:MAG: hypothetical protein RJA77_925 [Pseudomonadota bacterium]
MDGWDFKQYVLGPLFYRFISENVAAYIEGGDHTPGKCVEDVLGFIKAAIEDDARNAVLQEVALLKAPKALA